MTVDVTAQAADGQHAEAITSAVGAVPGVSVHKVSDRTFLLHIGGKLEVRPKVALRTRDDLSMAYTPGVARVCRAIAAQVAAGELKQTISVKEEQVRELLGPEQYQREVAQRVATPGVVTALAYTPTGGEVLFVEATRYEGKGQLHMTGQIGTVMKESAQAALSLVRSRADQLGLDAEVFNKSDLHVHVPAGAVPKDGPSAGIAMFTSIASLLLQRPCKPSVAMTGEITLRGLVLPVGGIKEKSLAAMRAGIRTVLLPKRNEKDLPDVPDEAKEKLEIVFVETVDEVLERALKTKPVKNMRQAEPAGAGS